MKAPKTAAAIPTTKPPAVALRPRAPPDLVNGLEELEELEEPVLAEAAAAVVAVLPDELPDPELEPPLELRESEVPQASL